MNSSRATCTKSKDKFTPEDDKKLLYYVSKLGTDKWFEVSLCMGNKTTRQCRERYKTYLAPTISHEDWRAEEDSLIIQKYQELGSKWSAIAKFFPHRTDTSVKNRCHVLLRKIKRENKIKNASNSSISIVNKTEQVLPQAPECLMTYDSFDSSDFSYLDEFNSIPTDVFNDFFEF